MSVRSTGGSAAPPEPHVLYRRLSLGASLDDGPLLVVGETGVVMVSATPTTSDRDAGVTDATLFRFPRLAELDRDALDSARSRVGGGDHGAGQLPLHQIARAGSDPIYALGARGVASPASLVRPAGQAGDTAAATGSTAGRQAAPEEIGYRELYGAIGDDELALVGRAIQVVDWDETTRYCPRCATPTEASEQECVKRCAECGLTQYPRLAPAMIVGVVRDGRLLLGQSPRFRGRFHSILAGFLEPGETAEECVRREVYEEVGVSVRNIRYFGSQPWPFPHSLMLGFTAEYESGDITPDPTEIIHADWYAPDEMPNVPGEVSISGRIINWFRKTYG